jgi:hypothetical protein
MRETGDEISASVAESVDTALVRALAEVAGISRPSLSPVDYGEVQLTVGCSDESAECLAAMEHVAEANAIVVRHLLMDRHGVVLLRLLYFDESGGPAQVQIAALAERAEELSRAVPQLVRQLFEIPAPVEQSAAAAAPAPAPAPASPPSAAAPTPASSDASAQPGASIGALTWLALGVGAATLAAGIVLAVSANADYDALLSTRVHTRGQARDADRTVSSIETRASLGNVLIPAGAVVLAAGAVLLGLDLSAGESDATEPAASVQLIPRRSGAVLALQGTFGGAL